MNPACFDVRDFGALGDGKTNDAPALQRAIDACAQQGGGTVVLHNGTFLSGTVRLQSHVELHLTSTAVLLGIGDLRQYTQDAHTPYRQIARSLIYASGCQHVAITGQGTINGQGELFGKQESDDRPVLVRLRDCHNVRLEGILLQNSGAFAVHPIHCRQLRINGLRIDNDVRPNNDALDIDGCQDVFIANCNIVSEDDCIALKTTEPGVPCRDIVITNCILSSYCAAIRVGPDAVADIQRVAVTNCVIRNTRLNGIKIQEVMGAMMRDMVFSNIVMEDVGGPISIRLAGWKQGSGNVWSVLDDRNWEQGRLGNILFDNIRARAMAGEPGMFIAGTPGTKPRNITFSNIDITFPGGGTAADAARRDVPDNERMYPEIGMFGILPAYGLYMHHAQGITLNNVQFHLKADDLRSAIVCDDVQDLELNGFRAAGHPQAETLIRLQNTQRAFISNSRALGSIDVFLKKDDGACREICLDGEAQ